MFLLQASSSVTFQPADLLPGYQKQWPAVYDAQNIRFHWKVFQNKEQGKLTAVESHSFDVIETVLVHTESLLLKEDP